MTGSYHNYFRIYDAEGGGGASGEITLQADKSAFKAKKIGGFPVGGPPGRPGANRAANGKKEVISTEGIDFNKKILHGSWHPREPTIAIAGEYESKALRSTLVYRPLVTNCDINQPTQQLRTTSSCSLPSSGQALGLKTTLGIVLLPPVTPLIQ